MSDIGELLGYDPKTLFGREADIRSRFAEHITHDKLRYAVAVTDTGRSNYEQAIHDTLVTHLPDLTSCDRAEVIGEMPTRGEALRIDLKRITARLLMPYRALEAEVMFNQWYIGQLCPEKKGTIPETEELLYEFKGYADKMNRVIKALRRLETRGIIDATLPPTRERVFRAVFRSPREYVVAMRKGVVSAMRLRCIQPVTIALKRRKVYMCGDRSFSIQSIAIDRKDNAPLSKHIGTIDATLAIIFGAMYAANEAERIWRHR